VVGVLQVCFWGLALFGLLIALAWHVELIAVLWAEDLEDLRSRCHRLERSNVSLRAQVRSLRARMQNAEKLMAIDEVAQRTTRAMLQVASEEPRTIDGRAIDRR
jgi:hypothetical protein